MTAYYNAIRASEGKPAWGRKCPACERIAYAWVGEICEDCYSDGDD